MTYMIKTNGTLIDEDIMFFLMDNDFDVQISLDGCREANDMNRVYMNQEGSYEDVIKVINKFLLFTNLLKMDIRISYPFMEQLHTKRFNIYVIH